MTEKPLPGRPTGRSVVLHTDEVQGFLSGARHAFCDPMKPPPLLSNGFWRWPDYGHALAMAEDGIESDDFQRRAANRCPITQVGETLWVRERHAKQGGAVLFKADYRTLGEVPLVDWKAAGTLPRKNARLFLSVTSISCRRLTALGAADVRSFGFETRAAFDKWWLTSPRTRLFRPPVDWCVWVFMCVPVKQN